MFTRTTRSFLGGNHREINKKYQSLDYGEQVQHQATGLGADSSGTTEPKEVMMIEETWMQPYLVYMVNKTLPADTVQANKIV
jgi:hypothetical protein